jgi:2-keto-3-deoxy-6-phosphogluconate aldolase
MIHPILRHIRVATASAMVATLFSTASFAVTPEQRSAVVSACSSDAMRFCMGSLGNEQRIIACMARNQSKLSARCKAAIPRG